MKFWRFTLTIGLVVVALSVLLWGAGIVHAGIKSGNVTNCTDAGLTAALSGGGLVTFDCSGAATLTITIAESKETAVVWGMPGELVAAKGADWVVPLPAIAECLSRLMP